MRLHAALALLCLPLAAAAGDGQKVVFDQAYLTSKANIETGRKVWENQCRHCHGAAAYPGKAPKLNPGQMEPGFIYDRVTFGFGKMPAWKDVFSLEQRKAVVAYVKSGDFSP
jgi:mono/diheme cytochrome c family protein